VIVFVLNKQKK